ncbi:MAG TPA: hypothetical protein VFU17_16075 [Candidatus Limnocylindrales bacterium]|nr:hypothetical protein [Candidatus Limnocylindrales bacterium]
MTDLARDRDIDLVVARLHLRLGSLQLARAELEEMAGKGILDDEGLIDLAEARWRTGDLAGAGEAANVAIGAGNEAVVALVIAAEATAAAGRPAEARRLASRALDVADLSVADVFAGMPRSSIWPIEPGTPTVAEPLFAAEASATATTTPAAASHAPGLWDDAVEVDLPDPAEALEAGRAALADGRIAAGALQLSLVLRLAPALAPAVLDMLAGDDAPELALVKGDAYRLVGHERDARLAFADAAASIPTPKTPRATKEKS